MQPVKVNITKTLTSAEMFFFQKSIELLHENTIDTYRLRLHNPRTLLKEISQVIQAIKTGAIRDIYGKELFKEAIDIFKNETDFAFTSVSKSYFMKMLGNNQFENIYYAANLLINDNADYAQKLYGLIQSELQRLNGIPNYSFNELDKLNRVIGYFYIELKSRGYEKGYLHNFIRSIFSPQKQLADFDEVYKIIGSLISRPLETFAVYVLLKYPKGTDPALLSTDDFKHLPHHELPDIALTVNKRFKEFITKFADWTFFTVEVNARDYLAAGNIVRNQLQKKFDLFFMGFSDGEIILNNDFFVVGSIRPGMAKPQYFNYELDGNFNSDLDTYIEFIKKIDTATSKPVDKVSLAKLQAGLRYLRVGSGSEELESKLLNYWIAMEYLFSSHDASMDKTARLQEYFNKIHSLSYATRLFENLNRGIENLSQEATFSLYDPANCNYLTDPATIAEAAAIVNDHPLLFYRINSLNERFKDTNAIKEELCRHQANVQRNLQRIYRIRNEIVHSAAKDSNIADITAHLKYYLIYIINGFIDFVINQPNDADDDGSISIEDYFVISKIRMESLFVSNAFNLPQLLTIPDPISYLN